MIFDALVFPCFALFAFMWGGVSHIDSLYNLLSLHLGPVGWPMSVFFLRMPPFISLES